MKLFSNIGIEITRNPTCKYLNMYEIVDNIQIKNSSEKDTTKLKILDKIHVDCGILELKTIPTKKLEDLKIQYDYINKICKGYPVTKNRTHTGGGHIHVELNDNYAKDVLYIFEWLCNRPWFSWSLLDPNDIHNATYNYIDKTTSDLFYEMNYNIINLHFYDYIKFVVDLDNQTNMLDCIYQFDKDSIIRVKKHYDGSKSTTLEFRFFQTPKSFIEITKNITLLHKIFQVNSKRKLKHSEFGIKYNKKSDLKNISLKESLLGLKYDLISLDLDPKAYSFMFKTLKERYAKGKHYLV